MFLRVEVYTFFRLGIFSVLLKNPFALNQILKEQLLFLYFRTFRLLASKATFHNVVRTFGTYPQASFRSLCSICFIFCSKCCCKCCCKCCYKCCCKHTLALTHIRHTNATATVVVVVAAAATSDRNLLKTEEKNLFLKVKFGRSGSISSRGAFFQMKFSKDQRKKNGKFLK